MSDNDHVITVKLNALPFHFSPLHSPSRHARRSQIGAKQKATGKEIHVYNWGRREERVREGERRREREGRRKREKRREGLSVEASEQGIRGPYTEGPRWKWLLSSQKCKHSCAKRGPRGKVPASPWFPLSALTLSCKWTLSEQTQPFASMLLVFCRNIISRRLQWRGNAMRNTGFCVWRKRCITLRFFQANVFQAYFVMFITSLSRMTWQDIRRTAQINFWHGV